MDELVIRKYLLKVLKNTSKLVKNRISKNGKYYNKRPEYNNLVKYVDKFIENLNDDKFFIIPGLRGVGKTTILFQLYYYLVNKHKIPKNRILYLNLDRLKDKGTIDLLAYLDVFIKDINEESYLSNQPIFIFVDEAQYVTNWGLVGKIIYDETINVFLIFTGSNALNLTTDNDSARRSLKKEVMPLTFSEYLNLKYYYKMPKNMKEELSKMLLTGNIEELSKIEKNIQMNIFLDLKRDVKKEWETFIQFGGLPHTLNKDKIDSIEYTLDMKNRIIEKDIPLVTSLNTETIKSASPLLNFIALQKPGTISEGKISNVLNIPKTQVHELLKILEKTLTIFNVKPYGSISKKTRHAWEYYCLLTQIKACIYLTDGESTENNKEYWGELLENYVAFSLYRLIIETRYNFNIFFDERKGGVDFLINTAKNKIIPVEVGIGKKSKKQVMSAIKYYNADYGIVISNATDRIIKDEKVIFVPYITFSLF